MIKTNQAKKIKIVVITCYKDPDYIRARTLRTGLLLLPNIEVIIIKNTKTNLLRYPEVLFKVIVTRFRNNPDIYLLTFRGYELLPFILAITWKKTIIFDEYINLVEWIVYEHKKTLPNSILAKTLTTIYTFLLKRCTRVLTDTKSHAQLSAKITRIPINHFLDIPVSTDEEIFHPYENALSTKKNDIFQVFYYGNMLPLHGLKYMLDAAIMLKQYKNIQFLFVGGDKKTETQVNDVIKMGGNIKYQKWIPFIDLPKTINSSHLCIGGPFGDTLQSQSIITGKTYQFLACQKAVLIGKNKETNAFKDKKNCLIVPQANAKAIAENITWAYFHKEALITIAKSGRMLYLSQFSTKKVSEKFMFLVDQLKQRSDSLHE